MNVVITGLGATVKNGKGCFSKYFTFQFAWQENSQRVALSETHRLHFLRAVWTMISLESHCHGNLSNGSSVFSFTLSQDYLCSTSALIMPCSY